MSRPDPIQQLSHVHQQHARAELQQLAAEVDTSDPYIATILQDAAEEMQLAPLLAQLALFSPAKPASDEATPQEPVIVIDLDPKGGLQNGRR